MAVAESLSALVERMPDADGRGMFTENIDKPRIEDALAEIYGGGREYVRGLVEMLGVPGSEADVKPRYALHALGNHILQQGDEPARRGYAETLAEALAEERPAHVKAFLCEELQWFGRGEAAGALAAVLAEEALVEAATMALMAIGDGAAAAFREALPAAEGKRRRNLVHGLAALADAESAPLLREVLNDEDREVRLAAGWGLAQLGDAAAVPLLLEAADAGPGWERIQADKHCLVLAEKLAAAGRRDEARTVYARLAETRTGNAEVYVREAAERGLASLG